MASIAEDFGRGVIDCTTRQCFQIHWIRLENIPEIFDRLERVGMTTSGACGDITRNVVGCTLAGLAHDEIVDGYATVRGDPRLLPRQQALLEPPAQVQDLGHGLRRGLRARADQRHRAVRRRSPRTARAASTCASAAGSPPSRASRAGWTSSSRPRRRPRSSPRMTGIFRDSEENRKARGKARLKFLVDRVGAEALREELEARVGRPLRRGVPKAPGPLRRGPHRRPPAGRRRATARSGSSSRSAA